MDKMPGKSRHTITIQHELREMFSERDYVWAMFCCCILLNRTRGHVVREVYPRLFARYPNPEAMAQADLAELREIIRRCGFQSGKAQNMKLMTDAFIRGDDPMTFPGVGEYAYDSYRIFVLKDFTKRPKDHSLLWVWQDHFSQK